MKKVNALASRLHTVFFLASGGKNQNGKPMLPWISLVKSRSKESRAIVELWQHIAMTAMHELNPS